MQLYAPKNLDNFHTRKFCYKHISKKMKHFSPSSTNEKEEQTQDIDGICKSWKQHSLKASKRKYDSTQ